MQTFRTVLKHQVKISNCISIIAFAVFFVIFQNIAFWHKLIQLVNFDSLQPYLLMVSVFIFLSCFFILIFSLLFFRYTTKPVLFFCFLASAASNYYALTYNIYMDKVMIANVLQTTTAEAGSMVTPRFVIWMLVFGVLPCALLWFVKIQPASKWYKGLFKRIALMVLALVVLLAAALPFYKDYAAIGRNNKDMVKLITPNSYLNGIYGYVKQLTGKAHPLKAIGTDAVLAPMQSPKKTIFVMVLGETSRAENFSLNGYTRETNPKLKQIGGNLLNFEKVTSCGTATAISVPCMFSSMPRQDYSASRAEYQENVMDIIQRAGYPVLWRENDSGCKGVCKRIPTQNVKDYDNSKPLSEDLYYDDLLLGKLDQYIEKKHDNKVIVLHTNGSHGPAYYERYRPEMKGLFKPTCDTASIENCSTEALVNTYDNTILHVDDTLNQTIELLKKYEADYDVAMLYMSDHGESLGEGGFYLHSAPYALAPDAQTQIPMVFWANDSFYQNRNIDLSCMQQAAKQNEFSHDYLFHTLLGLLNIQTQEYDVKLNAFSACQGKK